MDETYKKLFTDLIVEGRELLQKMKQWKEMKPQEIIELYDEFNKYEAFYKKTKDDYLALKLEVTPEEEEIADSLEIIRKEMLSIMENDLQAPKKFKITGQGFKLRKYKKH